MNPMIADCGSPCKHGSSDAAQRDLRDAAAAAVLTPQQTHPLIAKAETIQSHTVPARERSCDFVHVQHARGMLSKVSQLWATACECICINKLPHMMLLLSATIAYIIRHCPALAYAPTCELQIMNINYNNDKK